MNAYEKLSKAFQMDEWDVEDNLNNIGITLRGYTIYVHFEGHKKTKVTTNDVIEYYAHQAGNIVSGCRTLAGITGDWRNIDECAKQCLEIYKVLKTDELKRIARRYGMEPKGW